MSWSDKVSFKQLVLFCQDWRSRQELKDEFSLSPVESWHCFKWLKKLDHDFDYRMNVGHTARSQHVKARVEIVKKYDDGSQS